MGYLSANGHGVNEGSITLPRRGRMLADLRLAVPSEKASFNEGDIVTLEFQDGHTIKGACLYSGLEANVWKVKVVGGTGKLDKEVRPKFYAGIAARSVLSDMLKEVGEVPGKQDTPGVFERYVRIKEPCYLAIETLLHAKYPSLVWRSNYKGEIDVLEETWPKFKEVTISEYYPLERRAVLAPTPKLEPGYTLPGVGKLDTVRHVILDKQLRTEVFYL